MEYVKRPDGVHRDARFIRDDLNRFEVKLREGLQRALEVRSAPHELPPESGQLGIPGRRGHLPAEHVARDPVGRYLHRSPHGEPGVVPSDDAVELVQLDIELELDW